MSNVNWKGVAASAGATLAIVGICLAYALGQQNGTRPPVVITQAAAPAVPAPPPQPAVAAPPAADPQSPPGAPGHGPITEADMHALAAHVASLRGEALVDALWEIESHVTQRVTYSQLERNAERYLGVGQIYSGEVLEIQDQGDESFIRLAVDDNYDHVLAVIAMAPPDDSIVRGRRARVYGVLGGSFTYTSQANYQITIPKLVAIAVVPTSVPRRAPRQ